MFSKKVLKFFDLATAAAKLSDYSRIKIGAVIVKNGDIAAVGFNRERSHPIQMKYNIHRGISHQNNHFIHAEMAALVKAKHLNLAGASIYVSRKAVDGTMAMCKPCKACMKAIRDRGIRKVYFTSTEGYNILSLMEV